MNMKVNLSAGARRDLARALANRSFELSEDGRLYVPGAAKLFIGGSLLTRVNGRDEQIDPNTMTLEGISYLLKAGVAGFSQISNWYVALFSGNVTPTTALTAANFDGTQTEFTNYDEATRVAWDQDAESGQEISNSATKAAFTISTGGGTVWGAAIVSASAKEATTGTLLSCSKFGASRPLQAADVLSLEYTLAGMDG